VVLYDRDGNPIDVPDAEVPKALLQGGLALKKTDLVPVLDPSGKATTIGGEDAHRLLRDPSSGWSLETAAAREHRHTVEKYGATFGQEALAGLAGAGRLATFGLSDVALTGSGLVAPETLRGLQEANPSATKAGEFLGLGASLLGGPEGLVGRAAGKGIAGEVLRGATSLPRLASEVNLGTEALALRALGGTAGRGIVGSSVRRAAAMGAGSALEGLAYGAGQIISEEALGDHDLTAEQIVDHLGASALLGGGLGAGLGAGAELLKGVGRMSGAGLVKLWERASGATAHPRLASKIEETFEITPKGDMTVSLGGRAMPEAAEEALGPRRANLGERIHDEIVSLQAASTGGDKAALKRLTALGEEGRAARAKAVSGEDVRESVARRMAEVDDEMDGLIRTITDEDRGVQKVKNVDKIWDDSIPVAPEEIATAQLDIMDTTLSDVRRMRAEAKADGSWGFKNQLRDMEGLILRQRQKIVDTVEHGAQTTNKGAELFEHVDRFKKELAKLRNRMRVGKDAPSPDRDTRAWMEATYEKFREHLEDPSLYNRVGIEQKAYNTDYHRYLGNEEFNANFRVPVDKAGWQTIWKADPGKFRGAVDRIGKTSGDLEINYLKERYGRANKLLDQLTKSFDLGEVAEGQVARAKQLAKEFKGLIDKADDTIRLQNQYERIIKTGSAVTSMAGEVGGFMLGGIPGAMIGSLFGTIMNPGLAIKRLATIERVTNSQHFGAMKRIAEFFGRATKGAAKGAAGAARKAIVPSYVGILSRVAYGDGKPDKKDVRRKAFHRRIEELRDIVTDPETTAMRIATKTEGVASAAPKLAAKVQATAVRAADFLWGKAPKPPAETLYKTSWEPSDQELASFERYSAAIEHPTSILQDLHAGAVSSEAVEAVRAVYPRVYQEMVSELGSHLSELQETLSYADRFNLSVLLDLPIDATADPGHLASLQAAWAGTGKDGAPPMGGPPEASRRPSKLRTGSLSREKTTENSMTKADKLIA